MELGLSGKRVLVTGSTRGIGYATAERFLEEGARVVVHGSSPSTVEPAAAELTRGTEVSVASLMPGPTLTDNVRSLFEDVAEEEGEDLETVLEGYFEEHEPTSLLQRFEQPEEVARVAVFLCSDVAPLMNGGAHRAEGGVIRAVF